MNILLTTVMLIMAVMAVQYNAWVLFGALVIAAIMFSPRAWMYTLGASLAIVALYYYQFPSWQAISLAVIGVVYGIMTGMENRKERKKGEEIPPELLYYMLAGGAGGAAR